MKIRVQAVSRTVRLCPQRIQIRRRLSVQPLNGQKRNVLTRCAVEGNAGQCRQFIMRAVERAVIGDIGDELEFVLLDCDDIVDQIEHPRKDKRIGRIDRLRC
jgi:hypothetical protein